MLMLPELLLFALTTLLLVLTPGPNMIYCVSRALSQGPRAGMVSLAGVLLGFIAHLVAATLGLTAVLTALPLAFDALRIAGAAYLLWLAWDALRPGGRSPFVARVLPADSPWRLFQMGLVTNLAESESGGLLPVVLSAVLHPERGELLLQSVQLGAIQVLVTGTVNTLLILGAARIAGFLARSRGWLAAQRYLMATVLGALAMRMVLADTK
jgi:threonine/homoserine/homoserine lactone efflux protein